MYFVPISWSFLCDTICILVFRKLVASTEILSHIIPFFSDIIIRSFVPFYLRSTPRSSHPLFGTLSLQLYFPSLFPFIFPSLRLSFSLPLSLYSFPNTRRFHPLHLPTAPFFPRHFTPSFSLRSLTVPSPPTSSFPIVLAHLPVLSLLALAAHSEWFPPLSPSPCPFRSFAHLLHNRAHEVANLRRVILYKYISQINIRATTICMRASRRLQGVVTIVVVVVGSPFLPWNSTCKIARIK